MSLSAPLERPYVPMRFPLVVDIRLIGLLARLCSQRCVVPYGGCGAAAPFGGFTFRRMLYGFVRREFLAVCCWCRCVLLNAFGLPPILQCFQFCYHFDSFCLTGFWGKLLKFSITTLRQTGRRMKRKETCRQCDLGGKESDFFFTDSDEKPRTSHTHLDKELQCFYSNHTTKQ